MQENKALKPVARCFVVVIIFATYVDLEIQSIIDSFKIVFSQFSRHHQVFDMTPIQVGIYLKRKSGVGLRVCTAHGFYFVESVVPGGSVWDWNESASPELQICPRDRIDGFRVRGGKDRKLATGNELESISCAAVVLKISKPCFHAVVCTPPFGITRMKHPSRYPAFFIIHSILPSGSLQQWNQETPDESVSVGDIITGVNGVVGTSAEVHNMLRDGGDEKELMVLHYLP